MKRLLLRLVCLIFGHEWEGQREWDSPEYCRICDKERRK